MLKDDELTLAVIRNIASLSSRSATGIVIVGGLVSGEMRNCIIAADESS